MSAIFAPYPALRLLLQVIAGILCGTLLLVPLEAWLACSLFFFILLSCALFYEFIGRKGSFPLSLTAIGYFFFVVVAFAAYSDYLVHYQSKAGLLRYSGKEVILYGRVADRPERTEKGVKWTMEAEELFFEGRTITLHERLKVFMRAPAGEKIRMAYGDRIRVKGQIAAIPGAANRGEFDPRYYAMLQQVRVQLYCHGPWMVLHDGRNTLSVFERFVVQPVYAYVVRSVETLIPPGEERKLVRGVLLGEKEVLTEEVFDAFKRTGTAHVLAVSGFNVALLALGIHVCLQRVKVTAQGRWISFLLIAFILLVFSYVTGNSASVKRAAIMSVVLLGGETLGRKAFAVNSLAASDVIILFIDPLDLFNPGFLMTNAAVLAILLVYPLFYGSDKEEEGVWRRIWRFLLSSFFVSLAAIIGVSPVIAYYFGTFSLVSLVANLPVVLFSTLLMYALMPMLLVNLVSGYLASYFAMSGYLFAWLTLQSALFFSKLPFASIELKPDMIEVAIYYTVLTVAAWYLYKKTWGRLAITLLLGLNLFFWYSFLSAGEQGRGVVTVNLGKNLAVLFSTHGETVVIDTGTRSRDVERVMRQVSEYRLAEPVAAVQFFSPDSLVGMVPVKRHLRQQENSLALASMVIVRPEEKVLKLWSRERSLLLISGTSRLKEEELYKADVVLLWVYRFAEKQRREISSWLNYARPIKCIIVPGSFLTLRQKEDLIRFAAAHPELEIRSKARQIVIR
ncbi:ComEC/Rec2 family competence protein [Chlorobium phaeobacteroides]|uniref:ComEC/Rec2-related protein n=1 Tax=Chlorobium phaeobacteroides (strain DSM 266 / SMG 266 / 2430) TaxID=290317 RepID=A1BH62_CHLPD|nr:ComEC/Rec2 family competence protein [Chlorobium phaeobacteroides]ABL65739.1 ComEC/Rec2-related protein [Chlorobium phaeobacteroides DSM 266]